MFDDCCFDLKHVPELAGFGTKSCKAIPMRTHLIKNESSSAPPPQQPEDSSCSEGSLVHRYQ